MKSVETKKLGLNHSVVVRPKAPYNFDYSVHNPSHYPAPVVKYEKGKLWFSFRFKNKLLGIKFIDQGTISNPKIRMRIYYNGRLTNTYKKELLEELGYRFQ